MEASVIYTEKVAAAIIWLALVFLLNAEMRNGMSTLLLTQGEHLEREELLRLLACFIFEIQVNWVEKVDEDPPHDIFDRLATLVEHAPPAVLPLVEHLRCNPPEWRKGEFYTYSLPFVRWLCE